jgi:hypothetical protein
MIKSLERDLWKGIEEEYLIGSSGIGEKRGFI